MPDIRPFVIRGTGAARILTDAINAAHAAGLTVSTAADIGVICLSSAGPAWAPDPRATAVSVLGCVLLAHQPPIVEIDHALAHVFGTRPEFAEGVEDRVSGKAAGESGDRLYGDGYFVGVQLRSLVSTVPCGAHLVRYPRGERCPKCQAAVPIERSPLHAVSAAGYADAMTVDESTDRIQLDTPRSVITSVLAELTDSQELETLADRCSARAPKLPPALAEDLRIVEFTLRALATDARKLGQ